MNFFGHALVAQRTLAARGSVAPQFVLGAMLPDFASMLRSRLPRVSLEPVQEGMAFHHLTDDAFHGCEAFLEYSRAAIVFLEAHGLARGPARAVAHVGVELLLDAAFAQEKPANEAYLCALDHALTEQVSSHIHWPAHDATLRFQRLCAELRARGGYAVDTPAALIAQRLRHILEGRPRLAMDDTGQSVVREWVMTARPQIVSGAALLLGEVEQRLRCRSHSER